MYQFLRFVHIIGLALFLGSLLAFDVASVVAPNMKDVAYIYYGEFIETAATQLTLIGLFLAAGSGAWLMSIGNFPITKSPWLIFKIIFAMLLFFNTMFLLIPNVENLVALAAKLPKGATPILVGEIKKAKEGIDLYGAINVGVVLLISYLGVAKGLAFKFFKKKD